MIDKDTTIDAGDFTDWFSAHSSAQRGDGEVPCGSCNACCRAAYFIHVTPDDVDARKHISAELLFPAPGLPPGHSLMGFNQHGACPMLQNGKCAIYQHRPQTCRDYDCRIFAATGLCAGGDEKTEVNQQASRWQFSDAGVSANAQLARLRDLARQLVARKSDPRVPENPTQLALLALKLFGQMADQEGWDWLDGALTDLAS